MKSWESRRTEFNHDWLKNKFMPALSKALNLLDDVIEDPVFEKSFATEVLPQWENKRVNAKELIHSFASEMSPKNLFNQVPLVRLSEKDKEWLGELLRNLWLRRYQVELVTTEAASAFNAADAAYLKLQETLKKREKLDSAESLRPARNEFAEFRRKCQKLADALSSFHGGGKVV